MAIPLDVEIIDADNARRSINAPPDPGRALAAESRPVVLSTEDLAVLSAIDTKLTTLAGYVDGLEALIGSSNTLATSLNGYADGIEALIGTTNTSLSSISGFVDGLETLNIALNGFVDGLETLNGAVNETAPASDTASSGLNGRLQRIAQRLTTLLGAGATTIAKAEDAASADLDVGVPAMAVRKATPANTSGADGDYEFLQMSAGRLWTSTVLESPAGTRVETTVAVGNTAAALFGATPTNGFEVVNTHATEWLYIRESASAATVADNSFNIPIAPRSSYTTPLGYKPVTDVSYIATTAGHAVIGRRW